MKKPTYEELEAQRDELLVALEECANFIRGPYDVHIEYLEELADEFLKDGVDDLIARAKGGAK